jgi:uncharacterized repeat protein (TIGR01451 family)
MLLESPQTNALILMAEAGPFNSAINNVNLTFDDSASSTLSTTTPIVSGTYRPSHFGIHNFDPPAPAPPYVTTLYALPNGSSPNGVWSLFVEDDSPGDRGSLDGPWSLSFDTINSGTPAADLSLTMFATPDPIALVNHALQYTLGVTNSGPATATGIFLTNFLPSTAAFISCSATYTLAGTVLTCNLGALPSGAGTSVIINVQPTAPGFMLDSAVLTGNPTDFNLNNNSVAIRTSVLGQPGVTISHKEPGSFDLVISFPTAVTNYNFRIEASDSLFPPNWVPVSSVQTPSGGQISITVSPTNRSQFFRLHELP